MRALIIYASCEGQTEKIATRMAEVMNSSQVPTDTYNVTHLSAHEITIDAYDAVVLGSPLHYGRHDPRIGWCIKEHRRLLCRIPSAFFSVSLGIVSKRAVDRHEAEWLADEFLRGCGWEPSLKQCFAGALRYSRYGWLTKQMMHWIAKQSGTDTDPQRDHEFTDWAAVDDFATRFVAFVRSCKQSLPDRPRFSWSAKRPRMYLRRSPGKVIS